MNDLSDRPQPGRHDLYYGIHKGLRLGHARNIERLSATDWDDPADRAATLSQLRTYLGLARGHLNSEETKIHPAVEAVEPGASDGAHEGHDHHDIALSDLDRRVDALERAHPAGHRAAGHALYLAYADFVAADFAHMAEEEGPLLGALHRLFSDDQLREIEGRIVAAIPPVDFAGYMGLILPALSAPERVGMLSGMQADMPPEAFAGILRDVVRPALAPDAFALLVSALPVPARRAS